MQMAVYLSSAYEHDCDKTGPSHRGSIDYNMQGIRVFLNRMVGFEVATIIYLSFPLVVHVFLSPFKDDL